MNVDPTKLTVGEIELLQWQYGGGLGGFKEALWKAIQHADISNLNLLSTGFPDQVEAYRRFTSEDGYWEDVMSRAGLIQPKPEAANEEIPVPPSNYDH